MSGFAPLRACRGRVPYPLWACVSFLRAHGLDRESLLRIPGDAARADGIVSRLASGERLDLARCLGTSSCAVDIVSTVLKRYLEAIPEPLVPPAAVGELQNAAEVCGELDDFE